MSTTIYVYTWNHVDYIYKTSVSIFSLFRGWRDVSFFEGQLNLCCHVHMSTLHVYALGHWVFIFTLSYKTRNEKREQREDPISYMGKGWSPRPVPVFITYSSPLVSSLISTYTTRIDLNLNTFLDEIVVTDHQNICKLWLYSIPT